jgi:hypothetical protein
MRFTVWGSANAGTTVIRELKKCALKDNSFQCSTVLPGYSQTNSNRLYQKLGSCPKIEIRYNGVKLLIFPSHLKDLAVRALKSSKMKKISLLIRMWSFNNIYHPLS